MTSLEQGIETLMNEVDPNCKIIKFESVTAYDHFSIVLRSKMQKSGDNWSECCSKWVDKFSNQTNSKWVVKATFPKVQRIEYRKVFFCKENSISSRNNNKSCAAKIDIKIKKSSIHTVKKDKLLKTGYNAEIKVLFQVAKKCFNHLISDFFLGSIHTFTREVIKATNVYFKTAL